MNSFIRSGDIRRGTLKSPEIGLNFACFWPLNFFEVRPPKFWTGIIKLGLVLTIVQKFVPVGPHISEISRGKKIKKTSRVKLKSFRKLSFSSGLTSKTVTDIITRWREKDLFRVQSTDAIVRLTRVLNRLCKTIRSCNDKFQQPTTSTSDSQSVRLM